MSLPTDGAALNTAGVASRRPRFERETRPFLKLPEGASLGMTMCVDIGPDDHIWLLHSTRFLTPGFPDSPELQASRLPAVVEFDADGNFVQAWGGLDHLPRIDGRPQWPDLEETIAVDEEGCIWIFGSRARYDHAALRFSREGELLLRLGEYQNPGDNDSHDLLFVPTDVYLDTNRREAFISDGYGNNRVVTFNVDTGEFIRAWGAYGRPPAPAEGEDAFHVVHSISRGPDGYLYVCDRVNNRIQVFDAIGRDDVVYLRHITIAPGTMIYGAAAEVEFSRNSEFMYVADNSNSCVWIVSMQKWEVIGWFAGKSEEGSGNTPDSYYTPHRIVSDRDGNLLIARVAGGIDRYKFLGVS